MIYFILISISHLLIACSPVPGGIRFWGEVLGLYDRPTSTCVLTSHNMPVMWGSGEEAGS